MGSSHVEIFDADLTKAFSLPLDQEEILAFGYQLRPVGLKGIDAFEVVAIQGCQPFVRTIPVAPDDRVVVAPLKDGLSVGGPVPFMAPVTGIIVERGGNLTLVARHIDRPGIGRPNAAPCEVESYANLLERAVVAVVQASFLVFPKGIHVRNLADL